MRKYGRGVRRVPGQMNKLEAKYAEHLEINKTFGNILWWSFEPIKLRLADRTFYSPDFLVMSSDERMEVHEVKGTSRGKPWAEDDAMVKIKVAASIFPFKFLMIWKLKDGWQQKEF